MSEIPRLNCINNFNNFKQTDQLVANLCKTRKNLVFLNRTSYDLDEDHVILGCVLWSEMQDEQQISTNIWEILLSFTSGEKAR